MVKKILSVRNLLKVKKILAVKFLRVEYFRSEKPYGISFDWKIDFYRVKSVIFKYSEFQIIILQLNVWPIRYQCFENMAEIKADWIKSLKIKLTCVIIKINSMNDHSILLVTYSLSVINCIQWFFHE